MCINIRNDVKVSLASKPQYGTQHGIVFLKDCTSSFYEGGKTPSVWNDIGLRELEQQKVLVVFKALKKLRKRGNNSVIKLSSMSTLGCMV